MTTAITTTARRIARRVNRAPSGGFCLFGPDGSGGYWYSYGSQPENVRPETIKYDVPDRRVTAREVQEHLDRETVE